MPLDLTDSPPSSSIPPSTTTTTTLPLSEVSQFAKTGHTPLGISPLTPSSPPTDEIRPLRSPSMPSMRTAQPPAIRSQTGPISLLPAASLRSASDGNQPFLPNSASSPIMSKRTHLVREIATTERAYARDLGLIRDAFIRLRPVSQLSLDDSSPGYVSDASRRSSTHQAESFHTQAGTSTTTYNSVDMKSNSGYEKRLSAHERKLSAPSFETWTATSTHLPLTPGDTRNGPYGYFNTASASSASISSRKTSARSQGIQAKPLLPNDIKAVFLNLEQLAILSEELANGFEAAMKDDAASIGREGDVGEDRLGQVFADLVSVCC